MSLETLKPKVAKLIEKAQSGGTEEIENLIDQSGVLDSTEGTVEEKVEQLIELSTEEKMWIELTENKPNADYFFKSAIAKKLPKTNFINATSASQFCAFSKIEEIDYYLNFCNCGSLYESFRECSIKTIKGINCEKVTSLAGAFKSSALVTIEEPLNVQNVTTFGFTFFSCRSLTDIRFVEETIHYSIEFTQSKKLSTESIQSIIDGLATVETAQTLTLHADVKAKLTQTQLDTITGKNWNLA